MKIDSRARAWVRLHAAGVPARALVKLLRAFGSPEALLDTRPAQRRAHTTPAAEKALTAGPAAERLQATLDWLADGAHGLLAWDDAQYPASLLETGDPPPVLYTIGSVALLGRPGMAIVGSRNATPQGCADAEAFARALSHVGMTIVSGLAVGIDAAAHRGGLAGPGSTIAVIGTGPDRVYPARNRDLAHAIAESGLIISEFAPGTPPLPSNFPRRNRLISGLSRGLLVVEATLSSGSLITARLAGEQGREVFALPGSIHSPFARGCHKLIREGAKLVETAQDILEELRLPGVDVSAPTQRASLPATLPHPADPDAVAVLAALGHETLAVDALVVRSTLEAATVIAALTMLELDGRVAAVAGGRWQRRT